MNDKVTPISCVTEKLYAREKRENVYMKEVLKGRYVIANGLIHQFQI